MTLPAHAHDFKIGDIAWLASSTAPMQIVAFRRDNDGPYQARCFYLCDPRQTTQDFDVAMLRKTVSHQPHKEIQ